jgi:tRNA threonylcarbamoyladenosine biosynthesis protein TsaE
MLYTVSCAEKTEAVGYALAKLLDERKIQRAHIAMNGEMGVGKTVFVRGFASYFGIVGVKSPTYTVVNEYRANGIRIFHFDLYRIEDSDDLYSIGYDDYIAEDGFSLVEWSEKAEGEIPEGALTVSISRTDNEEERIIEILGV